MIDFSSFFEQNQDGDLAPWLPLLKTQITDGLCTQRFGDLTAWLEAYRALPPLSESERETLNIILDKSVSVSAHLAPHTQQAIEEQLQALIPWRKGPYQIFDTFIDTEWRSDFKWDRLIDHISPLKNRTVLDVGCGNGYHCWRMLGEQAKQVIGIDPSPRFIVQFYMLKKYLGQDAPVDIFPVAMEDMPQDMPVFDTTFSMGVLYHRRSPMDHIRELKNTLRPGGELILETLVIDGKLGEVLVPEGRYAQMRNIWFLPSVPTLMSWLKKCGFSDVRCVDLNQTSMQEQRATPWMKFQSLADFLDADDRNKTVEGHSAPLRAVIVAKKTQ